MTIGDYVGLLSLGVCVGLCIGLAFSLVSYSLYTWLKFVERG